MKTYAKLTMTIGFILMLVAPAVLVAAEPDYSAWNQILSRYYNPQHGMDYAALKARDAALLNKLRADMARVDPSKLNPKQELAFWMNLYNIATVGLIVDNYPVASIRDISTDRLLRINVFTRDRVDIFGGKKVSLKWIEDEMIRKKFEDARIHFAINCAALSCPPMRMEAFTGAKVDAQLDDQTRKWIATGVRVERRGDTAIVNTTKIMSGSIGWFKADFDNWGGGGLAFIRKYASPEIEKAIASARTARLAYDDYDWALNDWKR